MEKQITTVYREALEKILYIIKDDTLDIAQTIDFAEETAQQALSKAEDRGEVIKIECTNNFYPASCDSCGWFGSSELLEGCHQIADTGDYSDPLCPVCFSNKVEECESSIDFQELKSYYDLAINKLKLSVKAIEEYSLEKYFNDAPQPTNSLDELESWASETDGVDPNSHAGLLWNSLLAKIQSLKTITP